MCKSGSSALFDWCRSSTTAWKCLAARRRCLPHCAYWVCRIAPRRAPPPRRLRTSPCWFLGPVSTLSLSTILTTLGSKAAPRSCDDVRLYAPRHRRRLCGRKASALGLSSLAFLRTESFTHCRQSAITSSGFFDSCKKMWLTENLSCNLILKVT